jgi:tRNA(Ile)-lysidine synthase
MQNLIKKIQNTVFQQTLWRRGASLVVAISGGPDSVYLAEVLAQLRKKYALRLILAHVNYNLRGKESARDQKIVEALAEKYALELFVLNPEINKKKFSEESLRTIRYDFLEKIRRENGCDQIAVAHTQDDQVETFFLRLLRGAGLQGLSAMKFKNEKIVRPLLNISKKEILEQLKKNKIKYGLDRTNKENIFFRNKIRNILLPLLQKKFNPRVKELIFHLSQNMADDYAALAGLAEKNYQKVLLDKETVSVQKLLKLSPSSQRMIVREMLKRQKTNLRDIELAHIEEILKISKSTKGKSQRLIFGGLKIIRKGDKLSVLCNH